MASREYALNLRQELEGHRYAMEKMQADNRAVLIHLEAQVINAACDNPGLMVTNQLFLTIVRERLQDKLPKKVQRQQPLVQKQVTCAVDVLRVAWLCKNRERHVVRKHFL